MPIPSTLIVVVSNMRYRIVYLQIYMGKAMLSVPEMAGTVVDRIEVIIAIIIVMGARKVQPGL